MPAVAAHQRGIDNAHLGQKKRDDRYLKHDAHHERERGEGGDIRREVDLVFHCGINLVSMRFSLEYSLSEYVL